ncbi:hypothetical protein B0H17DRAFT_1203419 [Mycena rosella]|uniref:Uncharacterized protein n=1 Tax=Mycena rosella TaxID=1033263 RepID=A0AAD7DBX1_MYCRO|nr:hypothetical protein B0H17DRAFT_1203419 [Mycena rosella]
MPRHRPDNDPTRRSSADSEYLKRVDRLNLKFSPWSTSHFPSSTLIHQQDVTDSSVAAEAVDVPCSRFRGLRYVCRCIPRVLRLDDMADESTQLVSGLDVLLFAFFILSSLKSYPFLLALWTDAAGDDSVVMEVKRDRFSFADQSMWILNCLDQRNGWPPRTRGTLPAPPPFRVALPRGWSMRQTYRGHAAEPVVYANPPGILERTNDGLYKMRKSRSPGINDGPYSKSVQQLHRQDIHAKLLRTSPLLTLCQTWKQMRPILPSYCGRAYPPRPQCHSFSPPARPSFSSHSLHDGTRSCTLFLDDRYGRGLRARDVDANMSGIDISTPYLLPAHMPVLPVPVRGSSASYYVCAATCTCTTWDARVARGGRECGVAWHGGMNGINIAWYGLCECVTFAPSPWTASRQGA